MKILFAYDGSECAEAALQDLKRAGLPQKVDVLIMTMADVFIPPPIEEKSDRTVPLHVPAGVKAAQERVRVKINEAAAMAKQASERIKKTFPGWRVRHQALADSPAWAIVRAVDEWKPDLVAVGAQGTSVFGGRLILGSVSQRVLYEAKTSVRVARGQQKDETSLLRILIGVDNSRDSKAAIDAVGRREWPAGTQVRLLAVVDTVMAVSSDSSPEKTLKWIEVDSEENWDLVRQLYQPFVDDLSARGLDAAVMIRKGNPTSEILEEAASWGADCIFLGARGTRGIDRLLLGSVSSSVAARADCSVEVVRPKSSSES